MNPIFLFMSHGPRNFAVEKVFPLARPFNKLTRPSCRFSFSTGMPQRPLLIDVLPTSTPEGMQCWHDERFFHDIFFATTPPKLKPSYVLVLAFVRSASGIINIYGYVPISTPSVETAMGRTFRRFLDSSRLYTCSGCDAHLADEEHVISKSFQGRLGRAFLFEKAINVYRGPIENRVLISGIHRVADVRCTVCSNLLGWIYLEAKDDSQKYKEGRILLEKVRLTRKGNWF